MSERDPNSYEQDTPDAPLRRRIAELERLFAKYVDEPAAMRCEELEAQLVRCREQSRRLSELADNATQACHREKTRLARCREALEPFAKFAEAEVELLEEQPRWASNEHRGSISTWFGPSDFQAALAALAESDKETP